MTLRSYFAALRKRWPILLVLTLVGGVAGFFYGSLQTETYRSQASVVVIPAQGDSIGELVQGSSYVEGLVSTYSVVATSPVVLDRVIEELDLSITPTALARSISVATPLDTTVLEISVTGSNPAEITDIANTIATELSGAVEDLSPQTSDSGPAVRVEQIKTATEPNAPIAPNKRLLAVTGALLGLIAGVAFALMRQVFATRITTRNDISEVTEVPVLGEVFAAREGQGLARTVRENSTGTVAEAVRGVAAALRFANLDREAKVLLVTSPEAGDGKSSVALSLSLVLAEQGQRVLHVDADLRRGTVAEMTGLESSVGLTTVLVGDVHPGEAAQQWGQSGLDVLTSGTLPPNPGQLLSSEHLREFLRAARTEYDAVIVDSPPVLAVSDARWLAQSVDGIVIVARNRRTKRETLARAIADLEATRTPIFGIVLNGARKPESNPYYARTTDTRTKKLWRARETDPR